MRQKGQSLIELLVAVGIFALASFALVFFIVNSYTSGQMSNEYLIADFLAREGLEAARNIRDNSFSGLAAGEYGLAISGGNWIFQGSEENLSLQLPGAKRMVAIQDIGADRKKISSKVFWPAGGGQREVEFFTYFTNWQRQAFCSGICTPCSQFTSRNPCRNQQGCSWSQPSRTCSGICVSCDSYLQESDCSNQQGCAWTP